MTNWMTAAGLALIAGGLATLIGFRRALRTEGARRMRGAGEAAPRSARSSRAPASPRSGGPAAVRPRLPLQAGAPDISGSQQAADILAGLAARDEVRAARERAGAEHDEARAARERAGVARDEVRAARERAGVARDEVRAAGDDLIEDGRDRGADAHYADGRQRRPRGGSMDMDDLRRQLRDALEDLRREPRDEPGWAAGDEPGWAAGDDPRDASAGAGEQAYGGAEPEHRPLARAVLARADAGTREGARFDPVSGQLVRPGSDAAGSEPAIGEDAARTSVGPAPHDALPLGDRVDGWVRPQYGIPDGPSGDYWKPVPSDYTEDSSAYGWPVPVERLPAAPAYPAPAEGFGPIEESEPTALVPQWPPARPSDRLDMPRTWSVRRWDADTNSRDVWRPGNVAEVPRRRPSPRPHAGAEARSTVYVSRHAAEPS